MDKRKTSIIEMRSKGMTLAEIGSIVHLSRERVRQIIISTPPRIRFCKICNKELLKGDGRSYCLKCSISGKVYHLGFKGRERTRQLVRVRDNFTCQDCGKRRTPKQAKRFNKRLFDVHHLNGLCGKKSRAYDKVKDMSGLITLCHKCHYNRPEHTIKKRLKNK